MLYNSVNERVAPAMLDTSGSVTNHERTVTGMGTISIPLTQGKYALIDEADYDLVGRVSWYAYRDWHCFYARRNDFVDGENITLLMHRVLLDAKPGEIVDHRNGDGLDNRRCNLQVALRVSNNQNRASNVAKGSSKYKGVSWVKRDEAWQVRIRAHGLQRFVGLFDDEIEAAMAYDEIARKLHGESACVNFPLEGERSARRSE
jgi:hypothetical protein